MYKLSVIVRGDLNLSKGKACAQVGHAVLECYLRQDDKKLKQKWRDEGGKKVVLAAKNLEELYSLNDAAKRAGLVTAVIPDAGHTEVEPGTVTCLGIGPDTEEKIDRITKGLKPL
jgi:PTH2 family peptidyl-tRNA hydrolase